MPSIADRQWARFTPFDPAKGVVIRQPPGEGAGYWAGAPGAAYDRREQVHYLVYRLRRPRGVEPDRGAEVRIARSRDGLDFEDVWAATKDQLDSPSIERCALVRQDARAWTLYVSYVDPADQRWRIDRVEAPTPEQFDLARAQPVLTAAQCDVEGVKDPFVFQVAGLYHMVVSYAVASGSPNSSAAPGGTAGSSSRAAPHDLHTTADAYNTGLIRSCTGLASSTDTVNWQWEDEILAPREGAWDGYCARIGCLWYEPPAWLALYDGSRDVGENYEERCGLAFSFDLRRFHRASRDAPLMQPPHGSGALRYFDLIRTPDAAYFYYEMARPDGGHDLRGIRVDRS